MKVFSLSDKETAQMCRQLIRLDGECASLSWSRSIQDIPEDIQNALDAVQDFLKNRVHAICADSPLQLDLTPEQEDTIFAVCRKSANLRRVLGSGVVLAGEESIIVKEELLSMGELKMIQELLGADNNLVFF